MELIEEIRKNRIERLFAKEVQQDAKEVQQDIIRRMEKDHSIETAMLKAKIYDLRETLEGANTKIAEYEKREKKNKKMLTNWQEKHTDLYSIPETTEKIIIDAEKAAKRLLPEQFQKFLEILTTLTQ